MASKKKHPKHPKKKRAHPKKKHARCAACRHAPHLHTRSGCAHVKPGGAFCNCPRFQAAR